MADLVFKNKKSHDLSEVLLWVILAIIIIIAFGYAVVYIKNSIFG